MMQGISEGASITKHGRVNKNKKTCAGGEDPGEQRREGGGGPDLGGKNNYPSETFP